jgi:hypothetical protein
MTMDGSASVLRQRPDYCGLVERLSATNKEQLQL